MLPEFDTDHPPFRYDGPEEWLPGIDQALRRVVDPEVAMNIVDVGLVYEVRVADDGVQVTMTMTSAACPVADVLADEVVAELEQVLPASAGPVEVEVVWEPPWTPERMSARARQIMGW